VKNNKENKETIDIMVKELDCVGCGCCILFCPKDAIMAAPRFFPEIDKEKCNFCMLCLGVCPENAIKENLNGQN